MTRNEFIRRFPASSEETIRLNVREPVVGLRDTKRKQTPLAALDRYPSGSPDRNRRMVLVLITSYRKRLLDSDNLVGGAKALRDRIAGTLGCDDADTRISWEYRQVKSPTEGTHVLITLLAE